MTDLEFLESNEFRSALLAAFSIAPLAAGYDRLIEYLQIETEKHVQFRLEMEVKKLSLGPEDIIVFKHPEMLSMTAKERLGASMKNMVDNKIIVLEEGMDIEVLKKENSDGN